MMNAVPVIAALLLAACATREPAAPEAVHMQPAPSAERAGGAIKLSCDDGLQLSLQVLQDEVRVDGLPGGPERLLRDAGGVTPQQSVFSSARVRAEFGVGPQASEAVVHLLQPQPRDLHCKAA